MQATFKQIDHAALDACVEPGAICLHGVFDDRVDLLHRDIANNPDQPGPA